MGHGNPWRWGGGSLHFYTLQLHKFDGRNSSFCYMNIQYSPFLQSPHAVEQRRWHNFTSGEVCGGPIVNALLLMHHVDNFFRNNDCAEFCMANSRKIQHPPVNAQKFIWCIAPPLDIHFSFQTTLVKGAVIIQNEGKCFLCFII